MSDETAPTKSGWKTTEFWLTILAFALSAFMASGMPTDSVAIRVAGVAASILASLGYTVSRTKLKA